MDDDLLLLLSQQSQARASTSRDGPPAASGNSIDACKLEWHDSRRRSEAMDTLHTLLMTQLATDAEMFAAFEPFMSGRREKEVRRLSPQEMLHALPAPVLASAAQAVDGAVLRDYQVAGVQFLLDNFVRARCSILADDMGLGKTAQTACFLGALRRFASLDGPHLILCPVSAMHSWAKELRRWAPLLHVVKFHGDKGRRDQMRTKSRAVFVTSYATFTNERSYLLRKTWGVVVIDEAHTIKNNATQITSTAARLTSCFRLAVTGTPIQNTPAELWALMSFLYPRLTKGLEAPAGSDLQEDCVRLLRYIMIRRTKDTLDLGLPRRVENPVMFVGLSPPQQALYRSVLQLRESGVSVAGMWMQLRKVCNHPLLFPLLAASRGASSRCASPTPALAGGPAAVQRLAAVGIPLAEEYIVAPSAKMQALDALLREYQAEGHRVLVFSNFTSQLDIIEGLCVMRKFHYERLDGSCSRVERELSMARFNSPHSKALVFLITTTAGGVGVTLTGADRVVIYDMHFNPQMDRQAADRAHRIGQRRDVFINRFCTSGTLEDGILAKALLKAETGDYIIDGKTTSRSSEIAELLRHAPDVAAPSSVTATEQSLVDMALPCLMDGGEEVDDMKPPRSTLMGMVEGFTSECFVCKEGPDDQGLTHCTYCTKAYHHACVDDTTRKANRWTCPRHGCAECGQRDDLGMFFCRDCPTTYCFDCLDKGYLEMEGSDGVSLPLISTTYPEMFAEQMPHRRGSYYIQCLSCRGVVAADDSSSDGTITVQSSDIE